VLPVSIAREALKRIVPAPVVASVRKVNRDWVMRYGTRSYSQEGEDIFLNKIFLNQKLGFYVDIGAHHPVHFSNTYLFYGRGWHGINVDPLPGTKRLFDRRRPRDTNLEVGISAVPGALPFYVFDNAVLSTFDAAERDVSLRRGYRIVRTLQISVDRLDAVLGQHLPAGGQIDFMSVDVEGHENDVVESNDWDRFRPKIVCLEILNASIVEVQSRELTRFLKTKGYVFFAKIDNTSFFRESDFAF
jgi:FkbM family methyltransferase